MATQGAAALGGIGWLQPLAEAAGVLSDKSRGFFFFLLLAELVFVVICIAMVDANQRIWIAVIGALLMFSTLVGYLRVKPEIAAIEASAQQGTAQAEAVQRENAAVTPTLLAAAPVSVAEVEQRSDQIIAPDGTFAFAIPNDRWAYRETTLSGLTATLLKGQQLSVSEAQIRASMPFRAGPVMLLSERKTWRIGYGPATTVNGRPKLAMNDENVAATVTIYSVGRRGLAVSDMTAQHLFATLLGGDANLARVTDITLVPPPPPAGGAALAVFAARLEQTIDNVSVDGAEPTSVAVNIRLHVVERGYFLYVIRAGWLAGVGDQARIEADVQSIIDSVQMTNAANAVERIKRDEAETDEAYLSALSFLLKVRLTGLAKGIAERGEEASATEQEAEVARKLLADARGPLLGAQLDPDVVVAIEELVRAVELTTKGDFGPFRAVWAELGAADEQA